MYGTALAGTVAPSKEQFESFLSTPFTGAVTMLNLIRYRSVADYVEHPDLAPDEPLTGKEAYERYSQAVLPLLDVVGGSIAFLGNAHAPVIGPDSEQWDLAFAITYPSKDAFLTMVASPAYQAIEGHRTAAVADSRLVPLTA